MPDLYPDIPDLNDFVGWLTVRLAEQNDDKYSDESNMAFVAERIRRAVAEDRALRGTREHSHIQALREIALERTVSFGLTPAEYAKRYLARVAGQ